MSGLNIIEYNNINFYHITAIDNLLSILQSEGLYSDWENQQRGIQYTTIGFDHIKQRRLNKKIPNLPEYNEYTVGHFVPFYFAVRSPMLYVIHKRSAGLTYNDGDQNIIYLVSRIENLVNNNISWIFTDHNAAFEYAKFYNRIDDLVFVDWNAVRTRQWARADGMFTDIKSKKQAEVLVYQFFHWSLVDEIVVHNSNVQQRVENILQCFPALVKPVRVERSWYYD